MEPVGALLSRCHRVVTLLTILGPVCVLPGYPVSGGDPEPQVVLTLDRASAARLVSGDILFQCKLTLENHTGSELIVQSNFFSAFDGLILVVRDETGHE